MALGADNFSTLDQPIGSKISQSDPLSNEKRRVKKVRIKYDKSSSLLSKKAFRIPVGIAVILLEAVISYKVLTQWLVPEGTEETEGIQVAKESEVENVTGQEKVEEQKSSLAGESQAQEDLSEIGGFYTLSDVIVNPAYSQGRRFFIVSTVLAFDERKMVQLAAEREPVLRDRVISLLTQKSLRWLSNYANKEILRREILALTKEVLQCPEGIHVYFTKYVLQ